MRDLRVLLLLRHSLPAPLWLACWDQACSCVRPPPRPPHRGQPDAADQPRHPAAGATAHRRTRREWGAHRSRGPMRAQGTRGAAAAARRGCRLRSDAVHPGRCSAGGRVWRSLEVAAAPPPAIRSGCSSAATHGHHLLAAFALEFRFTRPASISRRPEHPPDDRRPLLHHLLHAPLACRRPKCSAGACRAPPAGPVQSLHGHTALPSSASPPQPAP